MNDRPDASKRPRTQPLQYESDRYERGAHPTQDAEEHRALPSPQSVVNGKYRIDVELGRGGMGAVFRAHHVELLKPVALKWLLPEFASDPSSRQRFGREARAVSNIKHDNVVDVYDYGIDGERGIPYLVMELLTGVSLSAHLAQRGRLAPDEALDIMIACMRGVLAAHKLGIVHRDLKPENIFLCESDEPGVRRVKVLDFGVAAALEPMAEEALKPIITRTTSRSIVGTVFYMPPEQLAGGTVDARADIYAIGVILYELLSGKPPYHGETLNEVTTAIVDGNAAPLATVVPELDAELAALVHRAMAPRKGDRFADMNEMIGAFQGVRARGVPALRASRASRPLWAIGAAVAVVLCAWLVWVIVRAPDSESLPVVVPAPLQPPAAPAPPPAIQVVPQTEESRSAATEPPASEPAEVKVEPRPVRPRPARKRVESVEPTTEMKPVLNEPEPPRSAPPPPAKPPRVARPGYDDESWNR